MGPDGSTQVDVNANDVVAFLVELVALALIGLWGYRAGGPVWAKVALAIGLVLAASVAWGLFAAPRARFRTPWVTLLVKVLVLGAAVAAGFTILPLVWAVVFAAVVVLNLVLIPPYGMMGAAVATIAAFTTMFVGMAWWSQRIYPVPYQWWRVDTAVGAALALTIAAKLAHVGLAPALVLALAYPLVLLPLGFYLQPERRAIIGAINGRRRGGQPAR